MGIVPDRDLEAARRLPTEFLSLSGAPLDRVIELVNRHWDAYGQRSRAELVQALLPVLLDMLNQGPAAAEPYPGLCEGIVATWLKRQFDSTQRAG
jgi:hypothetical protein